MKNPTQHQNRILGICGRATGAALALEVVLVSAVITTQSAQAQTYTESVLHSFTASPEGVHPIAGLVRDAQGNLYGTTDEGGDLACNPVGCGTVFKLLPPAQPGGAWTEKVLYGFTGTGGDGAFPLVGTLVLDALGNLYGTTSGGAFGGGTVFKVDPFGNESVLYSFCSESNCMDGAGPLGGLVRDAMCNLYGTTGVGGAANQGTVFKLLPPAQPGGAWTEKVLYSFASTLVGGAEPFGGLVQDAQGNLYGTTFLGGDLACAVAGTVCGNVFKVDPTGNESVLYSFCPQGWPCTDAAGPEASLVLDALGNLYGTTIAGGASNHGTVFKLLPPTQPGGAWTEKVLYSFTGTGGDGASPVYGTLVLDAMGNLYGTTSAGGAFGGGTVFKVDPTGNENVLYSFCSGSNCMDGEAPLGGLVPDAQGNLYGTTDNGGDLACNPVGCGTVFTLTLTVTPKSIIKNVTQLFASGAISSSDVETGLLDKLNAALAEDRNGGMCGPAGNVYAAFINQVRAQTGKAITTAAAAILIADAQYLEAHCP